MHHLFSLLSRSQRLYWKNVAFEEEPVVFMATSEFLTLIINLLEEEFGIVSVARKADVPSCCVCETEQNPACFVTLIFVNRVGSGCAHVMCLNNLLSTIMVGFNCCLWNTFSWLEVQILPVWLNVVSSESCTEIGIYVYHASWENLHRKGDAWCRGKRERGSPGHLVPILNLPETYYVTCGVGFWICKMGTVIIIRSYIS